MRHDSGERAGNRRGSVRRGVRSAVVVAVALAGMAVGARLVRMAEDTPASEQELKVSREVARIVTENLVKEIGKLGIPAVSAAAIAAR